MFFLRAAEPFKKTGRYFRALFADFAAKTAATISRHSGKGGGTALPGLVLLRLDPQALTRLTKRFQYGSILCSATNGKTTTTRLINNAARSIGLNTVTNAAGSNLKRGLAAALLDAKGAKGDVAILEVDEAALVVTATELNPSVIILMNLFSDQTDRLGSVENVASKWAEMTQDFLQLPVDLQPTLVVNADDVNLVMAVSSYPKVVWFGFDDLDHGRRQHPNAAEQSTCNNCGTNICYETVFVGHLGHWHCDNLGCTTKRPDLDIALVDYEENYGPSKVWATSTIGYSVADSGPGSEPQPTSQTTLKLQTSLMGLHNAYNVLACFAGLHTLAELHQFDLDTASFAEAIEAQKPVFGRGEIVDADDISIEILLVKNATGADLNLRSIHNGYRSRLSRDLNFNLHLMVVLNNRIADGRDISWIENVDFESVASDITAITISGDCAQELQTRLIEAGVCKDAIAVSDNVTAALDLALDRCRIDEQSKLWVMPSYTALLDLQATLNSRGLTKKYWQEDNPEVI